MNKLFLSKKFNHEGEKVEEGKENQEETAYVIPYAPLRLFLHKCILA
jgi:hypothetical protein